MGKGKELFGKYNDLATQNGVGSEDCKYASVLFQALLLVGERKVFELLEEADETGKKLALEYSNDHGGEEAVPSHVVLV
jgi:hypothetical protein